MRKLFDDSARPFYFFRVLLCIIGISQGIVPRDESLTDPAVYIRIIAAVIFLIGIAVYKSALNAVLAFVMFALLIAYITGPVWSALVSSFL